MIITNLGLEKVLGRGSREHQRYKRTHFSQPEAGLSGENASSMPGSFYNVYLKSRKCFPSLLIFPKVKIIPFNSSLTKTQIVPNVEILFSPCFCLTTKHKATNQLSELRRDN